MLNVIALMGRMTADPELKHTPNDVPVTSFAIAVDRSYVKQGGEKQTDFINVVAWRSTAEFVCKYFRKGMLVAVNGSLQSRTYTDKDGNNRKVYEVVADNVHFAEPKREGGSSYNSAPVPSDNSAPPSFSNVDVGDFEEISADDDDLPF